MAMIFTATTEAADVRSEIVGWSFEDSDLFVPNKPIGLTPSLKDQRYYNSILEAIHDGWKLLGPPTEYDNYFDWWLTK